MKFGKPAMFVSKKCFTIKNGNPEDNRISKEVEMLKELHAEVVADISIPIKNSLNVLKADASA